MKHRMKIEMDKQVEDFECFKKQSNKKVIYIPDLLIIFHLKFNCIINFFGYLYKYIYHYILKHYS